MPCSTFPKAILNLRNSSTTLLILYCAVLLGTGCSTPSTSDTAHVTAQPTSAPNDFVQYASAPSDGQWGFTTKPATSARVRLIPNLEAREKSGSKGIPNVYGVAQFFLDHDLTNGFVHAYTTSMFQRLPKQNYVLRFTPDSPNAHTGTIEYIRKEQMTETDVLGKNIAFFRQWGISDFEFYDNAGDNDKVWLEPCTYATSCGCPNTGSSHVPYGPQIPIWNLGFRENWHDLNKVNRLGKYSGGTVVIIWEVPGPDGTEVYFQDVHGSLHEILTTATNITKTYGVAVNIGISDAGPFARKVRADANHFLSYAELKAIAPMGKKFGAGFAYLVE